MSVCDHEEAQREQPMGVQAPQAIDREKGPGPTDPAAEERRLRRRVYEVLEEFLGLPNKDGWLAVDEILTEYQTAWMIGRKRITVHE